MQADHEIVCILVVLLVDREQSLFALVSKDGAINRMGTGSVNDIERDMFIGRVTPDLFLQVREKITPGVIHFLGQRLAAPQSKGKLCELRVMFKYADGAEATSAWRYGSNSQGPHPEVRQFVAAMVQATEPWFQQQKKMARRSAGST